MMSASEGLKSVALNCLLGDQGRKIPAKFLTGPSTHQSASSTLEQSQSVVNSHTFAKVKERLSLGAKLLQVGKTEKLFKQVFSVREGEQLIKTFRCCLSTTVGPIAGVLFVSTDTLAFCSDKSVVKLTSPRGERVRFHYKVVIPLSKIQRVSQSQNVKKASQKYLQVVTMDDFEFWFLGFRSYSKMFKCLQYAISQA